MNLQGKRKSSNIRQFDNLGYAKSRVDTSPVSMLSDLIQGLEIQADIRQTIQEDDPQKAVKKTYGR